MKKLFLVLAAAAMTFSTAIAQEAATATAEQVMTYLLSSFGIGDEYSQKIAYELSHKKHLIIICGHYSSISVACSTKRFATTTTTLFLSLL